MSGVAGSATSGPVKTALLAIVDLGEPLGETMTPASPEEPAPFSSLEGLLRDERGIRVAPEVDD